MSIAKTSKKKRTKKVSKGLHGARKHPLTTLQRALLGKGLIASFTPVEAKVPWRGVGEVHTPFDRQQAALNRKLYPHLFFDGGRR